MLKNALKRPIIMSLFICLVLFGIVACSAGNTGGASSTPTTSSATTVPTTQPATIPATGTTPGSTATPTPITQGTPSAKFAFKEIRMITTTDGWALTDSAVLKTGDGGALWINAGPPATPLKNPVADFMNMQNAWVAATLPKSTNPDAIQVLRTQDGGQHWSTSILTTNAASMLGEAPHFVNTQDGWIEIAPDGIAAGSESVEIFATTNGGQNWSLVANTLSGTSGLPTGGLKSGISFKDAFNGWATGVDYSFKPWLYVTHDGGHTWQKQSLPPNTAIFDLTTPPVFFGNVGVMPVTVYDNKGNRNGTLMYLTNNGGQSWTAASATPASFQATTVYVVDAQHAWAVDSRGLLYATANGGSTWQQLLTSSLQMTQLSFVDDSNGWAISTANPSAPVLLKTMDGGQTWVPVSASCGTWNVVPSPNGNESRGSILEAVAAVSATDVWAVGGGQLGGSKTLIEHWDGAHWSVVTSPNPGSNYEDLFGVTAVSASDVWAVGHDGNAGGVAQTLTEHWNGSRWSVVTSPNPGSGGNTLFGVAAISASDVWAVGITTSTSQQPLIEHWNGSRWSVVTSPSLPALNNALYSVAAVSESDVWAVGSSSTTVGQTLIEHWNGSHWSVVTSPSPGSKGNSLGGVTVVSASDVWAVGDFMKSGSQQALIEHWNGTSWQVVPSPSVGTDSAFSAVGAVSAKDVWAVGYTANGNQGFQTLTEQWNGSRWSVVTSPSPGSTNTSLDGVATISANSVWAVGSAESNTLTEHYQC
jgi:photosystem II stability/assembly factor-like uncharacterized protein